MTGGGGARNRSLTTILITDIVDSTKMAVALGDGQWRKILDAHDGIVRGALRRYRGKEANMTGDGFVATFGSPTDAIGCAREILASARELQIRVRAGVHTGEIELRGRNIGGIAVHIASRISALAKGDEILVSETVCELASGSELKFVPRGSHALKGVPGRKRIFAADDGTQPRAPRKPAVRTAKPKCTRVLLADDHPLWRQTLRGLLERTKEVEVVGEAGSGEEAAESAALLKPDVIVMDIDMPRMSGIEATGIITSRDSSAGVLILSSLKERNEVLAAVRAGARGYLIKTASPDEIADAVRRIAGGEIVFPTELTAVVLEELRTPSKPATASPSDQLAALTERESVVLRLLADGMSNAAISKELHLSVKTVESHIAAIFTKLDLDAGPTRHRRVQAAVAFLTNAAPRENP